MVAANSGAQTPSALVDSSGDKPAPRLATHRPPALGRNTRVMLTATFGAGLAVSVFDSRLVAGTQAWEDRVGLRRTSTVGTFIGGPGPIALGVALYAGGRVRRNTFATNTGREIMRAVLVSGAITALAKGAVGRSRPFASPGDADEFRPGHGFTNATLASFPSGHTSAAFATAMVLSREMRHEHPRVRLVVDPVLFGSAALVGFSRVYAQQHWPSDVLAGAALGTITGYEVVAHARGDRSRIGSRLMSHLSVGPSRNGMTVRWSRLSVDAPACSPR